MHRELCIMHANCQGDELETLLKASAPFSRKYRLARYTNYTREPIPLEALAGCALFLYQHLEEHWGEFSSASLLARLPATARSLCLPNLFFKGYWPFWTRSSPIDFGDILLNRLIDEGAPKPVILKIYLHSDIRVHGDLAASLEETLETERRKEEGSPVKVLEYFLRHWKERPLFHTINHPGRELLELTANGILAQLDLPPLTEEELTPLRGTLFPSYADFDLPIHPQVAAFHGLAFGGPETTYAVFGRRMTFAQYISRYIDCRLNGMDKEFLAYLHFV